MIEEHVNKFSLEIDNEFPLLGAEQKEELRRYYASFLSDIRILEAFESLSAIQGLREEVINKKYWVISKLASVISRYIEVRKEIANPDPDYFWELLNEEIKDNSKEVCQPVLLALKEIFYFTRKREQEDAAFPHEFDEDTKNRIIREIDKCNAYLLEKSILPVLADIVVKRHPITPLTLVSASVEKPWQDNSRER